MSKNVVELIIKAKTLGVQAIEKYKKSIAGIASEQNKAGKAADQLASKTKQAESKTKSAKTANTKLSKSVKDLNAGYKDLAVNVGSAVAALAALGAVKARTDIASQLVLDAQRLNVAVEDLTAAQYAAQVGAGVAAENFADALTDLRIKINEFSQIGSGGAVDFLQRVGLSADELNRKNPLEQLEAIAKAAQDSGDSINDFGTALDQLGSDNLRDLLPILVDGGEEFEKLKAQAYDLGLALNDVDAAAMRDLSKEAGKLGKVITSIGDKLAADVSPLLSEMARSFTGLFGSVNREIATTGNELSSITKILIVFQTLAQTGLQSIHKFGAGYALLVQKNIVSAIGLITQSAQSVATFFNGVAANSLSLYQKLLTPLAEFSDTAKSALESLDSKISILNNKEYAKPQFLQNLEQGVVEAQARFDYLKSNMLTTAEIQQSLTTKFESRQEPAELRDNTPSTTDTREMREAEQALLDQQIANQIAANKNKLALEKERLDTEKDLQLTAAKGNAAERLEIEKAYNKSVTDLVIADNKKQLDAIQKQRDAYEEKMATSGAANSINALQVQTELAKFDGQIADLIAASELLEQQTLNANRLIDQEIQIEETAALAKEAKARLDAEQDLLEQQLANQLSAAEDKLSLEEDRLDNERDLQLSALDDRLQAELDTAEESARKRLEIERAHNSSVADLQIQHNQNQIQAIEAQRAAFEAKAGDVTGVDATVVQTELAKFDARIAELKNASDLIRQQTSSANQLIDDQIALEKRVADAATAKERQEAEKELLELQLANQLAANENKLALERERIQHEKDLKLAALNEAAQADISVAEEVSVRRLEIERSHNEAMAALEIERNQEQLNALEQKRVALNNQVTDNPTEALGVQADIAKLDKQIGTLESASELIRTQLVNATTLIDEQISLENKVLEAAAQADKIEEVAEKLEVLRSKFNSGGLSFDELEQQSQPLLAQLETLMEGVQDTGKLDQLRELITNVKNDFSELRTVGAEIGKALSDNILNGIDEIISGTKSLGDAFRDMARQVVAELMKIYARQLMVKSLENLGAGGGTIGELASGALTAFFHQGGIAGASSGMRRRVDPAAFIAPMYYHTGGIAGLKADEVPAVLRKGEEVLTENDPRHRDNYAPGQQAPAQAVNITNTIDGQSVVDAFEANGGDNVIMNTIRANRDEIKSF